MTSKAQQLISKINEEIVSGIVAGAAISTLGQQYLANKRREEKVRQAGHGDELDAIKKQRLAHEKTHTGKLLVGKKLQNYRAKKADLKIQHQKIMNKGLAGHAKLFSQAGKRGQEQMRVT